MAAAFGVAAAVGEVWGPSRSLHPPPRGFLECAASLCSKRVFDVEGFCVCMCVLEGEIVSPSKRGLRSCALSTVCGKDMRGKEDRRKRTEDSYTPVCVWTETELASAPDEISTKNTCK